jgi:acyl-CoA thioesterase-1
MLRKFPDSDVYRNLKSSVRQTVIVYGTSLTASGAWAVETDAWFRSQFPRLVEFINAGGPGENSDWGLANLKQKVLLHHPDLVFLEFSYNDAHAKYEMSLDRAASNLDEMVKEISAQSRDATIVLQLMNSNWDAPNGNRSMSVRPNLTTFNEIYRNYARIHGLTLFDHYSNWQHLKETDLETFQLYIPDGSHPTKEGSLAITWPTIKSWLEET